MLDIKKSCEKCLDILRSELLEQLTVIKMNYSHNRKEKKADIFWEKL